MNLVGFRGRVVGLQFTPDGRRLVSWDEKGTVGLWLIPQEPQRGRGPVWEQPAQPPEQVEGFVRKVQDGLVQISIGSDAGLQKGHLLEVYRLKPAPRYLGQVKVIEVRAGDAVAQPSGRLPEPIQVGDRVASRIQAGR
jgi:hypothetical protein